MRYMLLIYGPSGPVPELNAEEERQMMAPWMEYTDAFQKSGKMLGGEALHPTPTATTVRAGGSGVVTTDGPFAETKEGLGGYYVMQADNLDDAIAWASKMPIIATGGAVEIRPIVEFA
jgi:hypothetical protein